MKLVHALKRRAAAASSVACSLLVALGAHASVAPQPGTHATYRDVHGQEWCVTVHAVIDGPGTDVWAWFSFNADPRRIEHAPVGQLKAGCKS